MGEIALKIVRDPRNVGEIAALTVTFRQSCKNAEDLRVALGAERCVEGAEIVDREGVALRVSGGTVAIELVPFKLRGHVEPGVLEKRQGRWVHVLIHGSYPVDKVPENYVRRFYSGLFETEDLGIECGDTTLSCMGVLAGGIEFQGTSNMFKTVGPECKKVKDDDDDDEEEDDDEDDDEKEDDESDMD